MDDDVQQGATHSSPPSYGLRVEGWVVASDSRLLLAFMLRNMNVLVVCPFAISSVLLVHTKFVVGGGWVTG